jgi:ubiquinone/menaquinone biosynthesis C-methylase UbiE
MSDLETTIGGATQAAVESRQQRAKALKHKLVEFWNTHQPYWDGMTEELSANSPNRRKAASYIPDGTRVLDVACGSAANSYWLAEKCQYFGSDISQTGLHRASRPGLRLACGDADQLPFASASFDAAISTFALEHAVNPVQMLREMHRVVRPGGRIVLLGPSWDLPFWYPNALRSKAQKYSWRIAYTAKRFLGQVRGWFLGSLPFFIIDDPDAFHREFIFDADAVYIVWSYEVIEQMKRWGCRLVYCDVDDRMLGTRSIVRLFKRLLFLFPPYRYAGSSVLMVFER